MRGRRQRGISPFLSSIESRSLLPTEMAIIGQLRYSGVPMKGGQRQHDSYSDS